MTPPLTLAVTGASGFIGRHFLEAVARHPDVVVRVLRHRRAVATGPAAVAVTGDLFDGASLRRLVVPGAVVVNLAWDAAQPVEAWPSAMAELATACAERGASRLLHGSTISVYGAATAVRLDESTAGVPRTRYERGKAAAESAIQGACRGRVPLVIVRPTQVFGAGGLELARLVESIRGRPWTAAFLRSCLFDRRRLHLTSVENVVAALLFLATTPLESACETFVVSEDDEPTNNFRDVEVRLTRGLGLRDYSVPRVPLPPALLSLLLRVRGRSDVRPDRVYDGSRLRAAGFERPRALSAALDEFSRHARERVRGERSAS